MKCLQIVKTAPHKFPEAMVTFSNVLFCLNKSKIKIKTQMYSVHYHKIQRKQESVDIHEAESTQ